MPPASSGRVDRIRHCIRQWFIQRIQECVQCCECHGRVSPWDTHCPTCGQESPARLSASAPVYLVLAFALLALTFSTLILPL